MRPGEVKELLSQSPLSASANAPAQLFSDELFAVWCDKSNGSSIEFGRYASLQTAEGVAEHLRALGCPSCVAEVPRARRPLTT